MNNLERIAAELARRRVAWKTAKDAWLTAAVAAHEAHERINKADGEPENRIINPTDPCWKAHVPARIGDVEPIDASMWCEACREADRLRLAKNHAARLVGGALTSLDRAFAKGATS